MKSLLFLLGLMVAVSGCGTAKISEAGREQMRLAQEKLNRERDEANKVNEAKESERSAAREIGTSIEKVHAIFGKPKQLVPNAKGFTEWFDDQNEPFYVFFDSNNKLIGWALDRQEIETRRQARTAADNEHQRRKEVVEAEQRERMRDAFQSMPQNQTITIKEAPKAYQMNQSVNCRSVSYGNTTDTNCR